jgi:AcrR family transcriptional regulator
MQDESDKAQARRAEMLQAAGEIFAAKGYAAATVDDIAARAGVSKGTMYNYFDSKQELFLQLLTASISEDEAHSDDIIAQAGLTAREKLDAILDWWLGRFAQFQQIGRLVLEFWATAAREGDQGPLSDAFTGMYARWRERLTGIFRQGDQAGEFYLPFGPEYAASLVMALLDGVQVQSILGFGTEPNETYLNAAKRAIFDSLQGSTHQADPPAGEMNQ